MQGETEATDSMEHTYYDYWGKARFGGKDGTAYHLLPYHCLDVAAVGKVLLDLDISLNHSLTHILGARTRTFLAWIPFFLALHDVGKFAEGFQNLISDLFHLLRGKPSTRGYAVRHDALGYALWNDSLWDRTWKEGWLGVVGDEREKGRWERLFGYLVRSVTGHHGIPPKRRGPNNQQISAAMHFSQEETAVAEMFAHDTAKILMGNFDMPARFRAEEMRTGVATFSWLLAGITVLCDWIASGHFELVSNPMPLVDYWHNHALPQAQKAVAQTGVLPTKASFSVSSSSLFPAIEILTPLQRQSSDCSIPEGPQLIILEDVTGSGKTEAALILAHRLMKKGNGSGIFIALPTMATSNAMYERLAVSYQRMFEDGADPSLLLSHSARHLSASFRQSLIQGKKEIRDDYTIGEETAGAYCAAWLADNRKKSLLADVGVGTLDQALLAALPSRYQSLRLFGLARNVLVVDEVHAYDPYMLTLLQNLLQFHAALGGSAILLSATLPCRMRMELARSFAEGLGVGSIQPEKNDYPLLTHVFQSGIEEFGIPASEGRRISQAVALVTDERQVLEFILQASEKGQCVCWIRNTVHDALLAYELLQSRLSPHLLMLFHARFAMGDRLGREEKVCSFFGKSSTSELRKAKVLVATQVVEQSLDLDFDLLISDLAPIDLLIQRAGRLHRHPRDPSGNPLTGRNAMDLREPVPFLIHSPLPSDNADADWYESTFPKGSYVYPSHGQLWLTARLLAERGGWRMPEDARLLVEAVYSREEEEKIPIALLNRDDEEAAKRSANRSLAHLNKLKLEEGYMATTNQWLEDTRTPTRLGELQTTLRLGRWDGAQLTPWFPEGDFPWEMSQVSVRATAIQGEDPPTDERLRNAMDQLRERLPDRGKWSVLVPLTENATGIWQGIARGPGGEAVTVQYDTTTGLQFSRQGG